MRSPRSAPSASVDRKIEVVEDEQGRIRQNMAELDKSSDLYKRYVKKFGAQEDEVEKLRPQIEALLLQAQQEPRGPGRIYRVAQSRLNRAASQSGPRQSPGRKGPVDPAGQICHMGRTFFAFSIAVLRDPMSHAPAAGGEVSLVPANPGTSATCTIAFPAPR